jgi:hypothetical protein
MLIDARSAIGAREAASAAYAPLARNFGVEPGLRPRLGAKEKG